MNMSICFLPEHLIVSAPVGVALSFFLGWIWYHPKVFGTIWMNSENLTSSQIKKKKARRIVPMTVCILCFLIQAFALGIFFDHYIVCIGTGLICGFIVGICFIGTSLAISSAFAGKTVLTYLVHAAYYVSAVAIFGACIGGFKFFM